MDIPDHPDHPLFQYKVLLAHEKYHRSLSWIVDNIYEPSNTTRETMTWDYWIFTEQPLSGHVAFYFKTAEDLAWFITSTT